MDTFDITSTYGGCDKKFKTEKVSQDWIIGYVGSALRTMPYLGVKSILIERNLPEVQCEATEECKDNSASPCDDPCHQARQSLRIKKAATRLLRKIDEHRFDDPFSEKYDDLDLFLTELRHSIRG